MTGLVMMVMVMVMMVQGGVQSGVHNHSHGSPISTAEATRRRLTQKLTKGSEPVMKRRKLLVKHTENEHKVLNQKAKGSQTDEGGHKLSTPGAPWGEVSGTVDHTGVTVWLQGREVYSKRNLLREWAGAQRRYHAGVHVLALHQSLPKVMLTRHFLTWQPTAHRMLAATLKAVQDGRVVLVLGAPDYMSWLNEEGTHALGSLGAQQGLKAVKEEAWVLVARKGHGALFETLITARNFSSKVVPPVSFSVRLPRYPERVCGWYKEQQLAAQMEFCETFEGYGEMCDCEGPIHLRPWAAPPLQLEEVIPVGLVTASRFPMVAQQVRTLWESPGGRHTPLLMLVDGQHPEAEALGRLLNITVVTHRNTLTPGTKQRVNRHIHFSLQTMLKSFPEVDKIILLEDDLVLAKDIISYFQQTSLLMSADETILCVNAYSYNAYPHTACDPHRIYRVQAYPYYGWMTSRSHATRMLSHWPPIHQNADWDLYIRNKLMDDQHDVIIPEVPRTRHEGGAGVHVSGLEQEMTYSKRPLNTLPQPILNLRRHWNQAYAVDLMATILRAKVVNVTAHPCLVPPVPRYQRNTTHVIYISLSKESDSSPAYKVLGKCLGFYYKGLFEHYRATYSLKYFETPLILVSCYGSVYCVDVPDSLIYRPSEAAVRLASWHEWRHTNQTATELWRVPATSLWQEVSLDNVAGFEVMLKA